MMILMNLVLLCALGLASINAGADTPTLTEAPDVEMPRVVMAKVGDRDITVESFMHFLTKHPGRVQEATTTAGKARVLREAIASVLLRMAAEGAGLIGAEPTAAELEEAYRTLEQKHFPQPDSPSEADLRAFYEAHRETFGIPPVVRVSQIQLRVPKGASETERAAVKARAEEALARLRAGEEFAALAAELTENPLAKPHSGDLGYVARHQLQWLDRAVAGLEIGEHTGVLPSPVGYDIIQLTDAREAVITPFEEARDLVSEQLRAQRQAEARQAYIESLAKEYGVSIELDELKPEFAEGIFD